MKYITIIDKDDYDFYNVGTITDHNTEAAFKQAIESHFDAEMTGYHFVTENVQSLTECITSYRPIEVEVKLNVGEEEETYIVELSQTWLYL